jgi:serine/threonine protein kinase
MRSQGAGLHGLLPCGPAHGLAARSRQACVQQRRRRGVQTRCAAAPRPPNDTGQGGERYDLEARGSPWGLTELAQSWSLGRLFSGAAPPVSLAPLDAALVLELGGSRGALDVLLRRCESEILAELSSFPADKLPRKRVPSQAAFVRVPFVSGDTGSSKSPGWLPLRFPGWGTGSSTLAVRVMLMTANALAVATSLNRQPRPRRGGLLVVVPPTVSTPGPGDEPLAPLSATLSALWRDAPFALDEWDVLPAVCDSPEDGRPGAVLLFAVHTPGNPGASTPGDRVLSAIKALQGAGVPFVLATLFLDAPVGEGAPMVASREAAEDAVRAVLAQLPPALSGDKSQTPAPTAAASSPRALAAQLTAVASAPACEADRLSAYIAASEVMLQQQRNDPEADDTLRQAVAQASARLEAERVGATLKFALAAADANTDTGLPQLRDALAATQEFAARDPPLTKAVATSLNSLSERASGRCKALSQVASARDALAAALLPHTSGADTHPEAVTSDQVAALQAALDAAAACAWPWQLAQPVSFAEGVLARWQALRALSVAAGATPPDVAALAALLRSVVSSWPDVDVTAPARVLAVAEAQGALDGGDQRLGAYHSAVSAAWREGLLTSGGAVILAGLRDSLRISPVEHEVVLRSSGALDVMASASAAAEGEAAEVAAGAAVSNPPVDGVDTPGAPSWRTVGAGVRYNEDFVLGVGSNGTYVFRGTVALTSRAQHPAAVKRIPRAPGDDGRRLLQLVEREVELLRLLSGAPAVVGFHSWTATDDHLFIATELCAESLAQHVRRQPDLPLARRLSLCQQAAAAVAWLHDLQKPQGAVAHNDLKPNNFLCSLAGTVKIADFGLAVPLNPVSPGAPLDAAGDEDGQLLTQRAVVPAAPDKEPAGDEDFSMTTFAQYGVELNMAHRAPEVQAASARLTSAVDIWSLGLVLFYVLTCGQDAHNARGQVDLSPLMRIGAPRTCLEARHLVACTLADDPGRRPTSGAVLRHPLFWSTSQALRACKDVHDTGRDAEERLIAGAMAAGASGGDSERGALLTAALCDLQGWQARISPLFFDRMAAFVHTSGGLAYEDTFGGLLRFIRNAVEHPPTSGEANVMRAALQELSPGRGHGGASPLHSNRLSVAARRALLGDYLLVLFPTLAIACWECGARPSPDEEIAEAPPPQAKARATRPKTKAKASVKPAGAA